MRWMRYMVAMATAGLVVACGGGGGSGGTPATGGTPPPTEATVTTVELLSAASTLGSASANNVVLTALAKNAANNGVAGVPVTFSADSGVLQSVDAQTDASGTAKATLSTAGDRSNRDIVVTVRAGSAVQTLTVPVTGSTVALAGAGSVLVGGQTGYTVTAKDSGGNVIAGAALTIGTALGNTVNPATVTTDATGSATFQYLATKAGNDTLTVRGAGSTATLPLVVSSVDFAFATPAAGADLPVATTHVVRVRYQSGGVGVAGQRVDFSSTRGEVVAPAAGGVLTDASGLAQATISSRTAGPARVTAQIAGGAQTTVDLNYVATTPQRVVLQINPAAIAPNATGSTANRAQLSALVIDADGNPVKGRNVNFSAVEDRSGGSIASGTGVTDANGQVSDAYIPGAITSGLETVKIRATVAGTGISHEETLTVSRQALFISIATSNTIGNLDDTTYSKPFSLQVNDATGAAVANQTVVLSVFPTDYRKGRMVWNGDNAWVLADTVQCPNEDLNRNGFLDPNEDKVDVLAPSQSTGNGNGRLEPGSPVIVTPATVVTDAAGRATFTLTYGEQYAYWLELEVVARTLVAGTESRAVFKDRTWALQSDMTTETVAPAGVRSPFGTVLSCTAPN